MVAALLLVDCANIGTLLVIKQRQVNGVFDVPFLILARRPNVDDRLLWMEVQKFVRAKAIRHFQLGWSGLLRIPTLTDGAAKKKPEQMLRLSLFRLPPDRTTRSLP